MEDLTLKGHNTHMNMKYSKDINITLKSTHLKNVILNFKSLSSMHVLFNMNKISNSNYFTKRKVNLMNTVNSLFVAASLINVAPRLLT